MKLNLSHLFLLVTTGAFSGCSLLFSPESRVVGRDASGQDVIDGPVVAKDASAVGCIDDSTAIRSLSFDQGEWSQIDQACLGNTCSENVFEDSDKEECGQALRFVTDMSVGVISHASEFEEDNLTIEMRLRFSPTRFSGRRGILSKDGQGYGEGAHFGLYQVPDSEDPGNKARLMARFQDTQSSHFRCSEALDPLTWHDVQIHLGTAGFELIVDGVSSNSGSFLWEESMDPFPCDNEEVSTSMRFNTNPWLIGRDNELGTSDTVVAKKTSAGGTLLDHLVIRVRDPVGP